MDTKKLLAISKKARQERKQEKEKRRQEKLQAVENEEEIVDGIVSWNKRKKEKYDSNKIVNTIKYMQNENIIQKGIFQNYTINRI